MRLNGLGMICLALYAKNNAGSNAIIDESKIKYDMSLQKSTPALTKDHLLIENVKKIGVTIYDSIIQKKNDIIDDLTKQLDMIKYEEYERGFNVIKENPSIRVMLSKFHNQNISKRELVNEIVFDKNFKKEEMMNLTDSDYLKTQRWLKLLINRSGILGVAFGLRASAYEPHSNNKYKQLSLKILVNYLVVRFPFLKYEITDQYIFLESKPHIKKIFYKKDILDYKYKVNFKEKENDVVKSRHEIFQGVILGIPLKDISTYVHRNSKDLNYLLPNTAMPCRTLDNNYKEDLWGIPFATLDLRDIHQLEESQLSICEKLDLLFNN